jgi:hypothetical protein
MTINVACFLAKSMPHMTINVACFLAKSMPHSNGHVQPAVRGNGCWRPTSISVQM